MPDLRDVLTFPHAIQTGEELCADRTEIEYLVEDFIPKGSLIGISGESGVNKTILALRMCEATLTEKDFIAFKCRKVNRVLYLSRDDPKELMQERLSTIGLDRLNGFHIWGLWDDPEPPYLIYKNKKHYLELAEYFDFIVIDSLRFFHPKEEDSSTALQEPLDILKTMTKSATVFFLHHSSEKSLSAKKYRGSTIIKDMAAQFYLLEANGNERRLSCIKSKFVLFDPNNFLKLIYKPEDYSFEYKEKSSTEEEDLNEILEIIKKYGPINQKGIADHCNLPEKRLRRNLGKGEEKGLWDKKRGLGKELIYEARDIGLI